MQPSVEKYSIVVLTYNREEYLKDLIPELAKLSNTEIIIVDNNSDDDYSKRISSGYQNVRTIRLDRNFGAVGRNYGIEAATGEFVITLDDDVWGITEDDIDEIRSTFCKDDSIWGICFKVLEEGTGKVINWCHHCDPEKFSDVSFDTYQVSEGAVAFRRSVFEEVGYYPEEFFISYEGPDLAFRIIKKGKRVIYNPKIEVVHAHAVEGRPSWRRYYYDTRNLVWLAYRHYNAGMWLLLFPLQIFAMFAFSLRDGFIRYFFKAIVDSIRGLKSFSGTRNPLDSRAYSKIKDIDKNKPPITYYIKKRLLKKGIKM